MTKVPMLLQPFQKDRTKRRMVREECYCSHFCVVCHTYCPTISSKLLLDEKNLVLPSVDISSRSPDEATREAFIDSSSLLTYDARSGRFYQNMEQKCEKQGSNHALTEAISSEAAELQNRVKS